MKVKALITGITGMVGSHLCDFLLKETDWDMPVEKSAYKRTASFRPCEPERPRVL